MDNRRVRPGKQGWNNQADTLPAPCRRECHDMLGPVVAEVGTVKGSEKQAGPAEQPGGPYVPGPGPARRAVGGKGSCLAGSPQGARDRGAAAEEAARRRKRARL